MITLAILGCIFYLGVILNLSLLQIDPGYSTLAKLITAAVIIFFLVLGTVIASSRSKKSYLFYRDRIIFGKKQVFYQEINSIDQHYSFWDSLFKTYFLTLVTSPSATFVLKHIPRTINIITYIKQMINYSVRYR